MMLVIDNLGSNINPVIVSKVYKWFFFCPMYAKSSGSSFKTAKLAFLFKTVYFCNSWCKNIATFLGLSFLIYQSGKEILQHHETSIVHAVWERGNRSLYIANNIWKIYWEISQISIYWDIQISQCFLKFIREDSYLLSIQILVNKCCLKLMHSHIYFRRLQRMPENSENLVERDNFGNS